MVPLYHGFVLFSSMTCILQTYYLLVLLLVQLIPIQFNKALSLNLFENIIVFIFFSDKNVNGAAKSSASSGPVGADFKPLLSTATATSYQSPPVTSTGKYLSVIFFLLTEKYFLVSGNLRYLLSLRQLPSVTRLKESCHCKRK